MNSAEILEYNLGEGCCAFTTKRTLGRDKERICSLLDIPTSRFVMPHQTHGTDIIVVGDDFQNLTPEDLEGKDAIMTQQKNLLIGVSTADCIPVLLYDKEQSRAICAVHAGWKGTVKRIVEKSILRMQKEFGTRPQDLKAVIGPGISQKNFEVGDEVYDIFNPSNPPEEESWWNNDFHIEQIAVRTNKWHIDLKECNRLQLLSMGVRPENIEVSPICTYDNTDKFFSARVEQKGSVKCGRNFNAIMLKNNKTI